MIVYFSMCNGSQKLFSDNSETNVRTDWNEETWLKIVASQWASCHVVSIAVLLSLGLALSSIVFVSTHTQKYYILVRWPLQRILLLALRTRAYGGSFMHH